jgi:ribosomal protein L7/L12
VLDALYAEDGPLVQLAQAEPLPAWHVAERSGEGDLKVGAAFTDLVAGFTAVDRIARAHGFQVHVKVFEAPSAGDPLAFLRPCVPPLPMRELFDVVLTGPGHTPTEVVHVLEELRELPYKKARALLDAAPVAIRKRLPKSVAEGVAYRLRQAGATAELRHAQE